MEKIPILTIGWCDYCGCEEVLAAMTEDCECLVCADCAQDFLTDGVCGVCGTFFTR